MAPIKSSSTRTLRANIPTQNHRPFGESNRALAGTTRNVTSALLISKLTTPPIIIPQGKPLSIVSRIVKIVNISQTGTYTPSPIPDSVSQSQISNERADPVPAQQTPFDILLNNITNHLVSTPLSSLSPQIPCLHSLMREYESNPSHWAKYAHGNPEKQYTRNLVCEVPGVFNLLLLVWTPGKKSPVHDHADAHCLMKVRIYARSHRSMKSENGC